MNIIKRIKRVIFQTKQKIKKEVELKQLQFGNWLFFRMTRLKCEVLTSHSPVKATRKVWFANGKQHTKLIWRNVFYNLFQIGKWHRYWHLPIITIQDGVYGGQSRFQKLWHKYLFLSRDWTTVPILSYSDIDNHRKTLVDPATDILDLGSVNKPLEIPKDVWVSISNANPDYADLSHLSDEQLAEIYADRDTESECYEAVTQELKKRLIGIF